jgi:regulator of protease activity HflC (stomatin/prohibitin superfamily)
MDIGVAIVLVVLAIVLLSSGIKIVPQNRAYVVERFGKFHTTM